MADDGESGTNEPSVVTADVVLNDIATAQPKAPSEISPYERQYVEEFSRGAIDAEMKYVHLRGLADHYRQKGKWSVFLMGAVGGMIIFQSGLLVAVGLDYLDFSKYEWLLPALLVQNLGQVIGLAVYAVKYLFSDISSQRPK